MHLLVKQKDGSVREFQFDDGPISIGRAVDSKIFLPDKTVSRKHAIIVCADDGKWMVQDLDSASKTYLNDKSVHKAEIKTGDCLRITNFSIEIDFEEQSRTEEEIHMEDTVHLEAELTTPQHETVIRRPDASHAPAMRLAAKRLSDFSQATEAICGAGGLEELLIILLNTMLKQFSAFHVWCALREQPSGPMTYHAGKRRDGKAVDAGDITLMEKIEQALEKGQSMVLPRVAAHLEEKERIRSAMISSIIRPAGCYGVLYVDNAMMHKHYSLSDLDYLMLLAMHTAAVLQKFLD